MEAFLRAHLKRKITKALDIAAGLVVGCGDASGFASIPNNYY